MYKFRPPTSLLAACVFSIAAYAAIIIDTTFPQASVGQPYNYLLVPSGGSGIYTYSVSNGLLPAGLTLSPSGSLSGVPLNAGQYSFGVLVSDSTNSSNINNATLRVTSTSGLSITTNTLANGLINSAYDVGLLATGGSAPYSWDIVPTGGSLPAGYSISSQGRITGTTIFGGIYPVTVRVTDANGNSYQSALTLRVDAPTLTLSTTSLAGASTYVPYSQGISAVGGTPPYTFTLQSGTLPAGVTLSSAGLLSGLPTAAGTFNFVVKATDSASGSVQGNYSIVVNGAGPRIFITTLPTGRLTQTYTATLTGQGGTGPYTFTLLNGTLPAGLTLNPAGTITGTPTATGVFPITVQITDSTSQTSQANLYVNVNSSAFNITTLFAPDAVVGTNYTLPLATAGGQAPVSYTLLSGTLPAGITLNSTGAIAGTPTTAGTSTFVIRATDSTGATAQIPFTIRIQSSTLTISQAGLMNAEVGKTYTSTLTATGGAAPYSFNLVTGTLPPGLTLSSNGNISGTPTTPGLYQVTYRVMDSNQKMAEGTFPIFVSGGPLNINTLFLPSGTPTQPYTANLGVTGGTAPYTFQVASGSLPTGLTLTSAGVLSGTLTQTTNGAFTVRITDAAANTALVSYLFSANSSGITLPTSLTNTGRIGQLYSSKLTTTGGSGAITFNVSSGALPPGLTLASDGTVSGTPTTKGTYVFTVQAIDTANAKATFNQIITIGDAQFGIANTQPPAIPLNTPYTFTFAGMSGVSPYTFAVASGTLPPGLTLASNGALTGTSTAAGSYPVTIRITDASGATATSVINFTVGTGSTLAITTSALPTASTTAAYNGMIMASGGTSPYTYQLVSGSLPGGLTLSPTGALTGTATGNGTSNFTVRVTDAAGITAQANLSIIVSGTTLSISNVQFSIGIVGRTYTSALIPTGGEPGNYSFALQSGTLPPGLTLSSAGVLSGTPTTMGSYPVVIRLTDAAGTSIQRNFNLLIGESELSFTNVTLPPAYVGQNYRSNIQAAAGTGPYTFTVTNGTLPAGLTLGTDGLLSGVPTTAGQSTVTFKVTDSTGKSAMNTLTIGVLQSTVNFGFTTLPNGAVGVPYRFTPTGGGTGTFTTYVLGGLPKGLVVTETGDIAGIPSQAGTFYVTLRTQNATGASVVSTFPITIGEAGFRFTNATLPTARVNEAYSQTLATTGGTGTSTFTVSTGALPTGFTLTPAGVLSGTPTAPGNFTFAVRATDTANGTAVSSFTLVVEQPGPAFRAVSLPSGTLNQAYSQTLAITGGTAPYTVTVSDGTLPTGLSITSAGVISGTPTAASNSTFTLKVTDSKGLTSTSTYLIGIGAVGAPVVTSVAAAANYSTTGIAPGEVLVIYGTTLGPANLVSATVTNNSIGTTLSNTRVLFDGVAVPVIYTSAGQVAVVAPFSLAGKTFTTVEVESLGVKSAAIRLPVLTARPAIFTTNGSGTGPGAILNQDATINTEANPAAKLSIITIYASGLGPTNPAVEDGKLYSGTSSLVTPITATINGKTAEVVYSGGAPGLVAGVAQINLRLPADTKTGANVIGLTSGATTTIGEVTVFVR